MPTYRNDTNGTLVLEDISGASIKVRSGESIETRRTYSITDLTLTAATPYFSPAIATTNIMSPNQSVTLDTDTKTIEINNSTTKSVDAYLNSLSSIPIPIISGVPRTIKKVQNYATAVIFDFSGEMSSGELLLTEWRQDL